ncbi:hypothetical protein PILCRDRAFT_813894 [Piloderma croceum F 1598]|uniref:Uncharacterized protein n=1 Tax=Piloderma croceum (strain F 1598) TaxID=765440 RepID=A0A0C3GAY7_PILCF|nr:hypothetical protein PILCRDRAFT_813894 [Piloderma croceum F 1598]
MPNQKPVPWFQLGLRMFRESQKRKDPRFRPLYHETLGTAWNYKKWRFSGQDTEFPVFTKSDNWSVWTKNTDWGKRWVAGEERWPNVPTEIRNFQGAVIKMSPGVQTQI